MDFRPDDLLITAAELRGSAHDDRAIRKAVSHGELVRVRRGLYCLGADWRCLDDRQRHVLLVAAVVRVVDEPLVAGRSAAAVWGIPVLGDWPADVVLLREYAGGGKSEPGVRRTCVGARRAPRTTRLGIPVTTLARTVVDLAANEGFVAGVVAADWALAHGVSRQELDAAVEGRTSGYGLAVAREAIAFADPRAESPGESAARASIYQLGFEVPELQVELRDEHGVIRLDFFWRSVRKGGEMDGKVKYTREEFTGGDPAEVVWREKKREDRARRQIAGMVRILWSHIERPAELAELLREAGIPRWIKPHMDPPATGSNRKVIQLTAGTRVER